MKPYTESMFVDSGAYTLFNKHVLGYTQEKIGTHGKVLDRPKGAVRGKKDYSFYDLRPGTEFRKYCDRYAAFLKTVKGSGTLAVNVDAIHNPDITWEVQQFFEKEHGVQPVPVVHGLTPIRYLERYLETGRYTLIGLGGLGHAMKRSDYVRWADEVYRRICPESNKFVPIIRTHGFAMTAWDLICRWPWWSVDSATWVKLAGYGWILMPPYKGGRYRYDAPPIQLNVSRKETERKWKFWWRVGVKGPRQIRNRHIDNSIPHLVDALEDWIDYIDLPLGEYGKDNEVKEEGVVTDFKLRAIANLIYFKNLQESRPKWPYPLDPKIRETKKNQDYQKGFGLV